jgi:hypothetical protein
LLLGLGFFLFARRYLGNTYLFLFLLVLRCFTSQGMLRCHKDRDHRGLLDGVSPFGNLRITGCFTPTRSLSQQRHVLHRLLKSRHPPYALKFPVKKFENHKSTFQWKFVPLIQTGLSRNLTEYSFGDRSRTKIFFGLSPASKQKDPSTFRTGIKLSNIQSLLTFIYQTKNRLSGGRQTKESLL